MQHTEMPCGEQDVRRLLNSLRRPELASADPLGRLVCELTATRTPNEAVRALVERAFFNRGHMGARLARLVVRCDLDGSLSHEGVASELGLSPRQFYRYRTRAVRLLAAEIRALLEGPENGDDLEALIAALEAMIRALKDRRLKLAG